MSLSSSKNAEGRFFSTEKVNTGRQPELDLLKALCVIGMIFVHVLMDLSMDLDIEGAPSLPDQFRAEFFGAATFMVCMGIGMRYMHNQRSKAYVMRGFGLLTIGQLLNICRDSIPNLIAWGITGRQIFIANALLVLQADILSFAGLAFLLMALFKKLRLKDGAILGVSVGMNLLALIAWHMVSPPSNYLASQLLGYFIITIAESYFPLLCYFIFVAFGYFIGSYYPYIKDKNALANRVMLICFPLAAIYYVCRYFLDMSWLPKMGSDLQYSMKPTPDAIATCLFTLGFLALLAKAVKDRRLPRIVMHFSKYINNYYCLHFMFIMPLRAILIAATGGLMTSTWLPVVYAFFVTAACYLIIELNEKYWHIHFAALRGTKAIIFFACVWIGTIAIVAYAYPRIDVYANIWNDYLLG